MHAQPTKTNGPTATYTMRGLGGLQEKRRKSAAGRNCTGYDRYLAWVRLGQATPLPRVSVHAAAARKVTRNVGQSAGCVSHRPIQQSPVMASRHAPCTRRLKGYARIVRRTRNIRKRKLAGLL